MNMIESIVRDVESKIFKEDILTISRGITSAYEEKIKEVYRRTIGDMEMVCLVSFGSFGRRTMAPFSDIDISILVLSDRVREKNEDLISQFITSVWNLGLQRVECSVRTPAETLSLAFEDVRVLSYLADMRFIIGDFRVFRRMKNKILETGFLKNSREHIFSLLVHDRETRISKNSDMVQPDIKRSLGGIDDFVSLNWLRNLISKNILVHPRTLEKDFRRLLELRTILHLITKRNENKIYVELVNEIINFVSSRKDKQSARDPRKFMTQILSTMDKIGAYVNLSYEFVRQQIFSSPSQLRPLGEKYLTDGEYIYVQNGVNLDAESIMEIFKVSKDNNLKISPQISYFILRSHRKFVGSHMSRRVNSLLFEILTDLGGVARTLENMRELRFLDKVIPEFMKVLNLYQYFPPHISTVDRHSIKCVEEIEKILIGIRPRYVDILPEITKDGRGVLILAALLHDIGKGRKKDHSEISARISKVFGKRLGLSGDSLKKLVFLVKNHLSLSHFAQRRDIHDTTSCIKFASEFPDSATLDCLYILSIADSIATNPESWNKWKASLITEAYMKISELMRKGLDYSEEVVVNTYALESELKEIFDESMVKDYISSLSQKFISLFSYDRFFRYSVLFLNVCQRNLSRYTVFTGKSEDVMEVITIGDDEVGFLCECAGAFFLSGLNILTLYAEAGILGKAMNVFWVEPADEQKFRKFKQLILSKRLKDIVKEIEIKRDSILDMFMKLNPFSNKNSYDTVRLVFDNNSSRDYTIVEVYCFDRPGVLFDMTYAISFSGFDISAAKISTRENKVANTFYLIDKSTNSKLTVDQINDLAARLKEAIVHGVSHLHPLQ